MSTKTTTIESLTPEVVTKDNEKKLGVKFEYDEKQYGIPLTEFDPSKMEFQAKEKDIKKNYSVEMKYDGGDLGMLIKNKWFPSSGLTEKEEGEGDERKGTGSYSIQFAIFGDEDDYEPSLIESCILAVCATIKNSYIDFIKNSKQCKAIREVVRLETIAFDVSDIFHKHKNDQNKTICQKRAKANLWARGAKNEKNKVKGIPDIFTKFYITDEGTKEERKKPKPMTDFIKRKGEYMPYMVFNRYYILSGHHPSFTLRSVFFRSADVKEGSLVDVVSEKALNDIIDKIDSMMIGDTVNSVMKEGEKDVIDKAVLLKVEGEKKEPKKRSTEGGKKDKKKREESDDE